MRCAVAWVAPWRCPWSFASPSAVASVRWSTTASRNEAYFAHTVGPARSSACSNPESMPTGGSSRRSRADDPVLFYEPKRRYWDKGGGRHVSASKRGLFARLARRPCPARDCDARRLRAHGEDVLAGRPGRGGGGPVSSRSIDLRTLLSPLDLDTGHRLGREAPATARRRARGARPEPGPRQPRSRPRVTQRTPSTHLEAPVLRVGGLWTCPTRRAVSRRSSCPDLDRVLDAVDRSLAY